MKIGDNIREIREKERNFTQSYVADALGITTKAYSNIENNVSDPNFSRLLAIAEILQCDINYIINYKSAQSGYHNTFYNREGGIGVQTLNQQNENVAKIEALYEALLASEYKRIELLESILNNKA